MSICKCSFPLALAWLAGMASGLFLESAAAEEPAIRAGLLRPESVADLVKPRRDEWKWSRIPWQIDAGTAFRKAGEQGKPVYTFARHAGVPLGAG